MTSSSRTRKIIRRTFIGLLVVLAAFVGLVLAVLKRPIMYKIADNYKGWVVVKYDDPSCPPLQHQNIFVVIPVQSSGIGCTSSPPDQSWQYNDFEYARGSKILRRLHQTGWGGGGEIWARYTIPAKHSEAFFVGTEQELNKSWSQEPK